MSDNGVTRREALRITAVGGLALAAGGSLLRELLDTAALHRVDETRSRLGTLVSLTAVHPDLHEARAIIAAGFREMERLESILSRHRRDTPMWTLNQQGRIEGAPEDLITVLQAAAGYHHATGGAFDPTVAPLLALYAERHARGAEPPAESEVRSVLGRVGFQHVEIAGGGVRFQKPGMALTLDGIAKGFIVDRTVATLTAAGAERVIVDAGGDMASGGPTVANSPWTVGIQDPRDAGASLGRVSLVGNAVATSGDYMRSFTPDRRHHHILDPRTGRSPEHTSSVTVVTGTAMDADALSTALLVLGPRAGLSLLNEWPEAEGILVSKHGERFASDGMRGRL